MSLLTPLTQFIANLAINLIGPHTGLKIIIETEDLDQALRVKQAFVREFRDQLYTKKEIDQAKDLINPITLKDFEVLGVPVEIKAPIT